MPKKHGFFIFQTKHPSTTAQKIGEKLYKAAADSANASSGQAGETQPEGEAPKDAEVEEKPVEEEKK